jgi:dihydroxyacetone synthase
MCAISNGLAAFNKGTFLPVTSSFFMFYLYAAPAVRMAALQGLQQIHIATHDSIGTGEDGPTHQPIALPALYRAMPNTLYIRPCDSEETAGAFVAALSATETPTIISLSRQTLPQFPRNSSREGVAKGAYVFSERAGDEFDVTLIGVGSEMGVTMETAALLESEHGVKARVVSFPCQRLFEQQTREYKRSVLRPESGRPTVVIEAYAANGWERYADASFSMRRFGKSLPSKAAYDYFGFRAERMAPRIRELVEEVRESGIGALRGDFRDLNGPLGVGFEH